MRALGSITLFVLIPAIVGCKSAEPGGQVHLETMRARIVESRQETVPVTVRATGVLHARQTAILSAQVMGRVQEVRVREGDFVRAGQTLVILDDATLKAAAEQAEAAAKAAENQQIAAQANADLAASTLARYKTLQTQKSVSPQEMDEVAGKAEAASAQVNALSAQTNAMKAQWTGARTLLSYSRVAAPFAGIVTGRMVDPGALASPGVPLVQVDSEGPMQVQASIPESSIGFVRSGMKLGVSLNSPSGIDPMGTVAEIVPAADSSSHSFLIKINLPESKDLRAGMYATVDIPTSTKQSILVRRSAIVNRGSLSCAYVLDGNNVAQLRYVIVGSVHGDSVEVLSGLWANERVIDEPADRDLAGRRIEVEP